MGQGKSHHLGIEDHGGKYVREKKKLKAQSAREGRNKKI